MPSGEPPRRPTDRAGGEPPCCRVFAECNPLRVCDETLLSQGSLAICRHATSQFSDVSTRSNVNVVSLERFRVVSAVNRLGLVGAKVCEV